jgi:Tat protein translocase TatB subunit
MFDISFGELILVVAVAVIFIRPEDVPKVLRAVANAVRWVRSTTHELKSVFDDVANESGLKDVARDLTIKPTLIKGDDGKYYEAYDVSALTPRGDEHGK